MDRSGANVLADGNFDISETYTAIRCWNPPKQYTVDPDIFINNSWVIKDLKTNTNYKINFVEELPSSKTYKATSNMLVINATKQSQVQQVTRT